MLSSAASRDPGLDFFANLPEVGNFRQITDSRRYTNAPESWHLVITDVRGSTAAIEAGRYRDVNALGVASIVALRNAMPDVELPYVFGGDGATLLVPEQRLTECRAALRGIRAIARNAFQLELRAGIVPVATLRRDGHEVRVARFRVSPHVRLAMFSGGGFAEAERRVKAPATSALYAVPEHGEALASLDGFECRWRPVKSRRGQVVSLLVSALAPTEQERAAVYDEVIDSIERTASRSGGGHPLSPENLHLTPFRGDFSTEARVRSSRPEGPSFEAARSEARSRTFIGKILLGLGASAGGFDGRRYKEELVENTDFRKFDETLRMVLDLRPDEIAAIREYLERSQSARRLAFGMHCSDCALVTCFVRSYSGDHVHFVDGANGGYALAAKELKASARALAPR